MSDLKQNIVFHRTESHCSACNIRALWSLHAETNYLSIWWQNLSPRWQCWLDFQVFFRIENVEKTSNQNRNKQYISTEPTLTACGKINNFGALFLVIIVQYCDKFGKSGQNSANFQAPIAMKTIRRESDVQGNFFGSFIKFTFYPYLGKFSE